jgi:hypothetical protein
VSPKPRCILICNTIIEYSWEGLGTRLIIKRDALQQTGLEDTLIIDESTNDNLYSGTLL